jgi:hypothetical protein
MLGDHGKEQDKELYMDGIKDLEIYRCIGPNCKGGNEAVVCLVRGAKSRRYSYHVECSERSLFPFLISLIWPIWIVVFIFLINNP